VEGSTTPRVSRADRRSRSMEGDEGGGEGRDHAQQIRRQSADATIELSKERLKLESGVGVR